MDFWDATRVMFRRWYVALPLLLVTIGATGYTATSVEPDYVLTSYIQLIPAQTTPEKLERERTNPSNPWNQLGLTALSQAANYATVDQTFLDTLDERGYSTNFTITVGEPVAGATIEVVGTTRQQAVSTTELVIKRFQDSAQKLQTQYGVLPQDMITTQRLDQGENLKRPDGKVKRAIIAVFGTGFLVMAGTTIGFDAFLRRRRRPKGKTGDAYIEEIDAEHGPPTHTGPREWLARDSSPESTRVVSTADFLAAVAMRRPGEPGATAPEGTEGTVRIEDLPMDATIMLPMPQQWAPGEKEKGDSRR